MGIEVLAVLALMILVLIGIEVLTGIDLEGIGFESIGTGIEVLIEADVHCILA